MDGRQILVIAVIMSGPIEVASAKSRFFVKRTDLASKFPPDVFHHPFVIFRPEISFPSAGVIDVLRSILRQNSGRLVQPLF